MLKPDVFGRNDKHKLIGEPRKMTVCQLEVWEACLPSMAVPFAD